MSSHFDTYVLKPGDTHEFRPTGESEGAELSVLWGDLEKGPVWILFRFPPGYRAPMHWHTSDYHAVVLSGEAKHWIVGEEEPAVGHGSGTCWFQPGKQVHGDFNSGDDPVLILIYLPDGLDFIPAE
jgi:quercetin dioxygenase-like cupin family protein